MATQLKLTRDQLGKFLKDFESIKQFEKLFAVVDQIAPDFVNEVWIEASLASAKANQALSELDRVKRNQEVLTWLSMQ